jgi:hypothetical protein
MFTFLKITVLLCCSFIFCSFTPHGMTQQELDALDRPDAVQQPYTEKQFFQDAYNYCIANKLPVPEEYYDILDIPNPNIPAWAKIPATEAPKLRDQVPTWVRVGMLKTETKSSYNSDGSIMYVDKARGKDGDIGPFQMRRDAFTDVKKPGESFWKLERDPAYAEEMACRYLLFIYNGKGNKDWERTVMMYNVGPYKLATYYAKGLKYLHSVKKNGK